MSFSFKMKVIKLSSYWRTCPWADVSQYHAGQICYALSSSTEAPFRLNPRRSSHRRDHDHMIALWPSRARDASD